MEWPEEDVYLQVAQLLSEAGVSYEFRGRVTSLHPNLEGSQGQLVLSEPAYDSLKRVPEGAAVLLRWIIGGFLIAGGLYVLFRSKLHGLPRG